MRACACNKSLFKPSSNFIARPELPLLAFCSHKFPTAWVGQALAFGLALIILAFAPATSAQAQQQSASFPNETCQTLSANPVSGKLEQGSGQGAFNNKNLTSFEMEPGDKIVFTASNIVDNNPATQDPRWRLSKSGQGPGNGFIVGNNGNPNNPLTFARVVDVPMAMYENTTNGTINVNFSAQIFTGGPQDPKGASFDLECSCTPAPNGSITIKKVTTGGGGVGETFEYNSAADTGLDALTLTTTGDGDANSDQQTFSLPANETYDITEVVPQDWELTDVTCQDPTNDSNVSVQNAGGDVVLTGSESITCTFTNRKIPDPDFANIIVRKISQGGVRTFNYTTTGLTPQNFGLTTINPGVAVERSFADLNPGAVQISITETVPPEFALTSLQCTSATGQSVFNTANATSTITKLDAGDVVTCTYTNTRRTGTVIINKTTVDGDGTFDFSSTINEIGDFQLTTAGNTQTTTFNNVPTGTFSVTEADPTGVGFDFTGLQCTDPSGGTTTNGPTANIDLEEGETVECTYTNTAVSRFGTVIINKTTIGGDGTFSFSSTNNAVGDFPLTTNGNTATQTFNNVPVGAFTIAENDPTGLGFELTDLQCNDPSGGTAVDVGTRTANINLAANETVQCTYTNSQRTGSLTIGKRVIGTNANFTFSGTTPFGNFTLSNGQTTTRANLPPGNFVITETLNPIYSLNSITCVGNSNAPVIDLNSGTLTIFVPAGDDVTCTFENGQVRDPRMEEETRRFIHRRVDNLLTHKPDRARMLRRLQDRPPQQGSLKDTGSLKHSDSVSLSQVNGTTIARGEQQPTAPVGTLFGEATDARSNDVRSVIEGSQTSETRNPFFDAVAGQLAQSGFGQTSFKFGTSLSEIRSKAAEYEAQRQKKNLTAAGLDFSGQYGSGPRQEARTGLDIWVEGQISRYKDNIGGVNRDGDFRILYVGADYAMAPGLLIGVLAQFDDTREDISQTGERGKIDGTGWMAGPYIGARLYKNLFLDIRAAWGTSDNDILLDDTELGLRTGKFETDRWLVTGTLTGSHSQGAWRFSPQVELAYGHEEYDTYQNSIGLTVLGSEAAIGRLTGTLEIGYHWSTATGYRVEPHASIAGIWNFDSDDLVINDTLFATDESRARVEGGVTITTPLGWSVRGAANYDGIGGDDFESYGGSLWVSVPLN